MKIWIPGQRAPCTLLSAASISDCLVRAKLSTTGVSINCAMRQILSTSPGDAPANPASITSTQSLFACLAYATFLSGVMEYPGACSPSLSVVSNISICVFAMRHSFRFGFQTTAIHRYRIMLFDILQVCMLWLRKERGLTMARRKDRRKSRAQIKNDTRSVLRAIGQMCNERGVASESHLMDLLHDYRADGKIEEAIKADRFSWLDFVLHTDCIVRRTNGKLVPIQSKSSRNSAQRFIEKHRNSCIKKFGALPVVVVMPPYGLYGQELEKAKR